MSEVENGIVINCAHYSEADEERYRTALELIRLIEKEEAEKLLIICDIPGDQKRPSAMDIIGASFAKMAGELEACKEVYKCLNTDSSTRFIESKMKWKRGRWRR